MARTPRYSMARSRLVETHKGLFCHRFRVQILANVVHATGVEDRTPRRMDIFLSVVSVAHLYLHTYMRVAQDMFRTWCTCARLQSHPPTACFIDHSSTCLSRPPPSTSTALHVTGSGDTPAPLRQEDCSTALTEKSPIRSRGTRFSHSVDTITPV